MLGFVDGNNITNNGEEGETVQDIITRTQHDAQLWNDQLRATGGALNLEKFFAQVIDFQFGYNGAPVIAPADPKLTITIQDRLYNKEVVIKPISPYKTYRSLGTEQGTSKNQKQQHLKLMKTSGAHTRKLACSAMSPKCAWVHYTAVFQSSVGYPLSMCHLNLHQLHDLQKKYIPTLMNKIGIQRTHAHALVFGPRAYGGLGCNDLLIEQGMDSVQNLIRQLQTPGYGRQLARIFLRTYQNASGSSLPLLKYPSIRAPHLEGHYYVHIRRFLAKHKASLGIECIPKATYERQGDEYIMDIVCSPATTTEMDTEYLQHYTDTEIRQIYYCKSYLQVQRVSDLCTADGVFVLPAIVKGERSIRQCASKLEEIKQERPSGNLWTVWRKFLSTICRNKKEDTIYNEKSKGDRIKRRIGTKITKYWSGIPYIGKVISSIAQYYKVQYEDGDEEELNHGEVTKYMKKNCGEGRMTREIGKRMGLIIKLGDWNIPANESERMWPFYYSCTKDILYRSYREKWHQQGKFYYDCHNRNNNKTYDYTPTENINYLPADAVPTDVMDMTEGWRLSGHLPMMTEEKKPVHKGTFMEYLLSQEEHISQYYAQIEFSMVPMKIYELFKSTKRVLIATDGGAIPLKGSLGFVFADEEGTILLTCFRLPAGNDPLSFRSEICAFLAAIRLVKLITQYYDEKILCEEPGRSKIQVYTDSASMIKKLKAYDKYPTAKLGMVLDSEWDVLSALHKALKWFETYPKISWVKSHQDDKVYDKTEMPLNAYLNSEADELATIGLKRLQEKPVVPMDPATAIQFHIKGRTITRDFKKTVREIVQLPYSDQYTRNIYHQREYSGYTNFASSNCIQEKEYTREITTMTKDVHHAGIPVKMTTTYFNATREEV
jgi:hypothetical protein